MLFSWALESKVSMMILRMVAATGALAMLARCPEVALRIASGARCQRLLEVLESTADPDIQHRVVSCLTGIIRAGNLKR